MVLRGLRCASKSGIECNRVRSVRKRSCVYRIAASNAKMSMDLLHCSSQLEARELKSELQPASLIVIHISKSTHFILNDAPCLLSVRDGANTPSKHAISLAPTYPHVVFNYPSYTFAPVSRPSIVGFPHLTSRYRLHST